MSDIVDLDEGKKSNSDQLVSAIRSIVEVQSKDSEVKLQELEIRSQEIASNERIAMKSIEAQEHSLIDHRSKYNKHLTDRYYFVVAILVLIIAFSIFMVVYGAKDLVFDLAKLLLTFGAGAYGGFQAGKNKKDSDD